MGKIEKLMRIDFESKPVYGDDIETYSTHDEGKSVVAERFIRTLKTKI